MNEVKLVVKTPNCDLPGIYTRYFSFDEKEGLNVEEGIAMLYERDFYIHHSQINEFLDKLGPENSFYIHRLLLSYFDAAKSLNDFWRVYGSKNNGLAPKINFKEEFTLEKIEKLSKDYKISLFNNFSLQHANTLTVKGRENRSYYFEANAFQEIMWAMNMISILKHHNLKKFDMGIDNKIRDNKLSNYDFVVYRMLQKREIGMVMYEWTNITAYNQPDFIKRISNIIELITKDIKRNREVYLSVDTIKQERDVLLNFVDKINDSQAGGYRKYFFGIFNASDLLGLYSRHGTKALNKFESFNEQKGLTLDEIYQNWMEKSILPNNDDFKFLFNIWHLATTFIVFSWIRLNHTETI